VSSPTDIERAIAVLALEYDAIAPATAAGLIRQARADASVSLVDLLLATVSEDSVLRGVAKGLNIRYYDMYSASEEFTFSDVVFAKADAGYLRRFCALPLSDSRGQVVVAVANPADVEMIDYLRSRYGQFALVLAPRTQVLSRLSYYATADLTLPSLARLPAVAQPTPVQSARDVAAGRSPMQEWLDAVLERAVTEGASDVHLLLQADRSLVLRYRVDGLMRRQRVPAQIRSIEAIGSLLSRCDTVDSSNVREPQDGTFSFESAGRQIDARLAMLPQAYGPTVTVRLLDSANLRTRLDDMGFSVEHLQTMRKVMQLSQGTILAVGPTGSGKSTTLYGLLQEVNAEERNVHTVENPIEYRLPNIGQTEVRDGLGDRSLTFARALRHILRMDPDVVLVGEIRDQETAEVAMQAAITGHLVLSTVHANSAFGAYPRLTNMGIPSYLVAEALTLVVSQRLLRRVHTCAALEAPTRDEVLALTRLGLEVPDRVMHPIGCPGCNQTGYRFRVAAVEVLSPSREFKAAAAANPAGADLASLAIADGFVPIRVDGLRHVVEQRTSVAELARVLSSDEAR
jgi:type II secretory ATPase GspE/PulE/Tfp pilus assembly ATPase PilB-like protein